MFYITVKQSPMYHQMTLEEFLFNKEIKSSLINQNLTNTRTYEVEEISDVFKKNLNVNRLIKILENFNNTFDYLRADDRKNLYHSFKIPKKSGGLRQIDAPNADLMLALTRLKQIFEEDFGALYHTSAFAYVKGRCTVDALKRHQSNESKWFGKYDLSNFFGSTTLDYVMKMLSIIFPFSEVVKEEHGREELERAVELGFLNDVLPQGTPLSPLITNLIMIPVDFRLTRMLRNLKQEHTVGEECKSMEQSFVYTRYADDFTISSKYTFDFRYIEGLIVGILNQYGAPFTLNKKKTRYGSSSGSNWNLGLMLNKDNNITVGYKNKKRLQAMISSYVMDKRSGIQWDKSDIQSMKGNIDYYRMVEKDNIDAIIRHLNKKFNVDLESMIKNDLR